jgi:hypothetical protein
MISVGKDGRMLWTDVYVGSGLKMPRSKVSFCGLGCTVADQVPEDADLIASLLVSSTSCSKCSARLWVTS